MRLCRFNIAPGESRKLTVRLPADLADWLDAQVGSMRFASQSHGVARALAIVRAMPDVMADTFPVE